MVKIYGISGSRAVRALWGAEECGVEYLNVPTHFLEESKTPEYLAINPNGRVPALVDGDVVLFESMAINLYLARRYSKALWPKSEADQALATQWSVWGISEIEPHTIPIVIEKYMKEGEPDPEVIAGHEANLDRPLRVLDDHMQEREYLLGSDFSIADLNLASIVMFTGMAGFDMAPYPKAARWLAECTSRPTLARAQTASERA